MSKHTPSPWTSRRTAVYDVIEGANGEHIAFVGMREPEEAKANRNLLLAAPELLAALKASHATLKAILEDDDEAGVVDNASLRDEVAANEAAIAKAEGTETSAEMVRNIGGRA